MMKRDYALKLVSNSEIVIIYGHQSGVKCFFIRKQISAKE